ncbi:MAG: ribonuclease III [Gammaproteobacteria bacterium]|nr:ribonuclease III [Gammaproteobacteria bacterium]
MSLAKLCKLLAYHFSDDAILQQALTHRSASASNNERLEFLGDSILGMVIADALYQKFPQATEGEMSRLRASLVKKETLSEIGLELDLGQYLELGSGELKSGGFRRASILADAVEAILGAIYLDSGFSSVRDIILSLYKGRLDKMQSADVGKDPKTQLQEYLQARGQPLPEYKVMSTKGPAHAQIFTVHCVVGSIVGEVSGQGGSRRKAEQDAAGKMFAVLMQE